MARLALDQMLNRQVVEKGIGDRQGKARIALGVTEYRGQKKGAVWCFF